MLNITDIAIQGGLILALSFLVGIEREQNLRQRTDLATLGGVRTFPLLGLLGYLLARDTAAYIAGLLVSGALLVIQYRGKMKGDRYGLTTEFSALVVYALGPFVIQGEYWLATAAAVICTLLLQMKTPLENLAQRLQAKELLTFSQFILLSAVILPLVPNTNYTDYQINPFRTWLIVVAVSGVSYLSYILQRWRGEKQGILLAGVLGGIYSSTVTTVALAKKSRASSLSNATCAGAIVSATGMMYIRIIVLVWLFSAPLGQILLRPFALLALLGIAGGAALSYIGGRLSTSRDFQKPDINPLQLTNAFLFALVFIVITVISNVVIAQFGQAGLITFSVIMGPTDIDPFIMSMTSQANLALQNAALAIAIAVASNNIFKGGYSWVLAGKKVGRLALTSLGLLGVLTPLLLQWIK